MYFERLEFLPKYIGLYEEMMEIFHYHNISWPTKNLGPNRCQQICLTHTDIDCDDLFFGSGSDLIYLKKQILSEDMHFKNICKQFKNTTFEKIYAELQKHFIVGRMRLIKINPHICLGWHKDTQNRLHYPLKTKSGAFMVIENEVLHLEQDTWYLAKTVNNHTALNASDEDRVHLLVNIWNEK